MFEDIINKMRDYERSNNVSISEQNKELMAALGNIHEDVVTPIDAGVVRSMNIPFSHDLLDESVVVWTKGEDEAGSPVMSNKLNGAEAINMMFNIPMHVYDHEVKDDNSTCTKDISTGDFKQDSEDNADWLKDIGLSYITKEPSEPHKIVYIETAVGTYRTKFHDIIQLPRCILLIYDLRCSDSYFIFKKSNDPVDITIDNIAYSVIAPGVDINIGTCINIQIVCKTE